MTPNDLVALVARLRADGGRYLLSVGMTNEEISAAEAPTYGGKPTRRWLTDQEYQGLCDLAAAIEQLQAELAREKASRRELHEAYNEATLAPHWLNPNGYNELLGERDALRAELEAVKAEHMTTAEQFASYREAVGASMSGNFDQQVLDECQKLHDLLKLTHAQAMELWQALNDLSFECDGVFSSRAPSRETYNRTFLVMEKHRLAYSKITQPGGVGCPTSAADAARAQAGDGLPPDNWHEPADGRRLAEHNKDK